MADQQQPQAEQQPPGEAKPKLNVNAKSFEPRVGSPPMPANPPPTPSSNASPKVGNNKSGNSPNSSRTNSGSPNTNNAAQQAAQQQQLQFHQQQMNVNAINVAQMAQAQFAAAQRAGFVMPPMMPGMFMPQGFGAPGLVSPLVPPTPNNSFAGAAPPTPGSASQRPTAAAPSPMMMAAPPSPMVNVGNAALQQLKSNAPPKFACVLLIGIPKVGKTSCGRRVVQELSDDNLPWAFFSGADHMREGQGTRPHPWDVTRDVFDALSRVLDDQLAKQTTSPIRGLLIDKQCRGTEELYYLTSLLKSKGLLLSGVIGMDAADPDAIQERNGFKGDDGFKEKLKFHRVIYHRIKEVARTAALWHTVDAMQPQDNVTKRLRSVVLGCSSLQPTKQINAGSYHDHLAPLVDSYATYASALSSLFNLARGQKPGQFPGFTNYVPLSNAVMADRKRSWKDYYVRRKSDGNKYVLLYDGTNMFLIPRHMRCVFQVPVEAWLGVPLLHVGKFVFDGELVKLTKERTKEKFLVHDILCWCERGASQNSIQRSSWKERHEFLTAKLCGEGSAFFSKCDLVIVHQLSVDLKKAAQLFEPCDYPTDGLVLQHTLKRDELVLLWRAPEAMTVDFRLGAIVPQTPRQNATEAGDAAAAQQQQGTPQAQGSSSAAAAVEGSPASPAAHGNQQQQQQQQDPVTFKLEVFDQRSAKYVEFRDATVQVPSTHKSTSVVEGALVVCGIDTAALAEGTNPWVYHRTRSDIPVAAFKAHVEEILADCIVTKANAFAFLGIDLATTTSSNANAAATPSAGAKPTTFAAAARSGFGSALSESEQQQQQSRGGSVPKAVDPNSSVELLAQLMNKNQVSVTTAPATNAAAQQQQHQQQRGNQNQSRDNRSTNRGGSNSNNRGGERSNNRRGSGTGGENNDKRSSSNNNNQRGDRNRNNSRRQRGSSREEGGNPQPQTA